MISEEERKAIEMIKEQKENVEYSINAMECTPEDYDEDVYNDCVEWNKNAETILNLIETQNKSIEILVAQKEEFKKDSNKWFKKLQEEHTKYEKINDRKNKIIDKLITALAEERGTDEDEIREVFGCE